MRPLIIGSGGFIGTVAARRLSEIGHVVSLLHLFPAKRPDGYHHIQGDWGRDLRYAEPVPIDKALRRTIRWALGGISAGK